MGKRERYFDSSLQVLSMAEQGKIEGWMCGTTVTTIYYLLAKALTRDKASKHLKDLFKIFQVSGINRSVLEDALADNFKIMKMPYFISRLFMPAWISFLPETGRIFKKAVFRCTTPIIF